MIEQNLGIQTADGTMETFVAQPEGPGPFPAVVIYMDAPGIREELRQFARRVAAEGYVALLPDLYYRRGRVRLDMMAKGVRETMFAHMNSLTNALIVADTESLLGVVEAMPETADGPKGCIGYCMSGQFIMTVAGTFPKDFRASISCYGVGLVTSAEDSPHRLATDVAGEILFAFAETDEYVPDGTIETLQASFAEASATASFETYPGTFHGFSFPERVGSYSEPAAEDVWQKTFAMFERQLR